MQQEFNSPVGQAIHTEKFIQKIHVGTSRLLSPQERRDLNLEVRRIGAGIASYASSAWTWMHRSVGVNSVDQMRVEHLPTLKVVLDICSNDADHLRALLDSLKQLKQAQASVEALQNQIEELKSRLAERAATSEAVVESTGR